MYAFAEYADIDKIHLLIPISFTKIIFDRSVLVIKVGLDVKYYYCLSNLYSVGLNSFLSVVAAPRWELPLGFQSVIDSNCI